MVPIALFLQLFPKKDASSEKIFVPLHMVLSDFVICFDTTKIQNNSVKTEASNHFFS